MPGYSMQSDPDKTARAIGRDLPISRKHAMELCRELRGMHIDRAIDYLGDVIGKKRAVPFKRYNRQVAHKKGTGFGPGRYPVKAAAYIRKVLEDAQNNAEETLGADPDAMRILHIAANKGRTTEGYMPRAHGRSTPKDHESVNIEVILEELEE